MPGNLLAYVDDHEPCLHCHGINECPKMNKGQQITLSYETYVHRDVKSCQYGLEKHENDQLLLAFITITCLLDLHLLA